MKRTTARTQSNTAQAVSRSVLALMLALTLIPFMPGSAQEAEAVGIGTTGDLKARENLAGTQVYFGKYNSSPILWYVVATDTGTATLWTTTSMGYRVYGQGGHGDWSGSDICAWLNAMGGPPTPGFLNNAFASAEQNAITNYGTTESNDYVTDYSIAQKIVLPSVAEIGDEHSTGTWGISYTKSIDNKRGFGDFWWLRSPGSSNDAAYVETEGGVHGAGITADMTNAIRPAFKLNLSSVLFTSSASAASGKNSVSVSSTPTAIEGTTGAIKLVVEDTTSGDVSLTTAIANTSTVKSGDSIAIAYTGAKIGAGKYLSAILRSSDGTMTHYGKLEDLETKASGTAMFTVPSGLTSGDYKLLVFNEQENGATYTDFTSTPIEIALAVDNTLPTISSLTPAGTVASTPQSIVITFSEAMDDTASGTVSLDNGIGTLVPGAWDAGKKVYTISNVGLTNLTNYTVTVSDFQDVAGNIMATDSTNSFSTNFTHTITATAGTDGSISPSGAVTVNVGQDQSFTITPDAGYQVADVKVDGTSVGKKPNYTFENVNADHTIEASFEILPSPAPVSSWFEADHTFTKGTNIELVFVADKDFSLYDHIEVDGKTPGSFGISVVSGSTRATMQAAYLETLSTGSHTVELFFTDNTSASGTFHIKAASSDNTDTATKAALAKTGDTTPVVPLIACAVLACVALAYHRFRKYMKQ